MRRPFRLKSLAQDNSGYLLEIHDDGKGFDLGVSKKTGAFGLQGIEERVQMLGGKLAVETAPGCGVKLTAHISSIAPPQR